MSLFIKRNIDFDCYYKSSCGGVAHAGDQTRGQESEMVDWGEEGERISHNR